MKAILTSAGFDNENLVSVFYDLMGNPELPLKALLIPTALKTPEAREYISVFKEDLYKINIIEDNIQIYDLDYKFNADGIKEFDVVLVCPGDPGYLMEKIVETDFIKILDVFQKNGGVYIGISAGSDIAAGNFPNGLGYIKKSIKCHATEGTKCGPLKFAAEEMIKITDNQAIVVNNKNVRIVE